MTKVSLNAQDPRPQGKHVTVRRAATPRRPGRTRRGLTARLAPSLTAMSERHVAALVRELEMAEAEDAPVLSEMNLDDSLLDPGFDDEHRGWGVHGHGPYRPSLARMTAHFHRDDEEGAD